MKSSIMNQAQPSTTTTKAALKPVSVEKTATGVFDTWSEANLWETQTFTTELRWGVRYSQSDPIGTTGRINLYTYVKSDPINRLDPSGLMPVECCDLLAEIVEIMNLLQRKNWDLRNDKYRLPLSGKMSIEGHR